MARQFHTARRAKARHTGKQCQHRLAGICNKCRHPHTVALTPMSAQFDGPTLRGSIFALRPLFRSHAAHAPSPLYTFGRMMRYGT